MDQLFIKDPVSGEMLSADVAISEGLFALDTGDVYFSNPVETVSFDIALDKGFAIICSDEGSQSSLEMATHFASQTICDNVSNPNVALVSNLSNISGNMEKVDSENRFLERVVSQNILDNQLFPIHIEQSIKSGLWDIDTYMINDPRSGHQLTLIEAITCDLIDSQSRIILPGSNDTVILQDAIDEGIIDPVTGMLQHNLLDKDMSLYQILNDHIGHHITLDNIQQQSHDSVVAQQMSLQDAIVAGLYDPDANDFNNVSTDEHISLGEAIKRNIIDPTNTAIKHPSTLKIITLTDAMECDIVDLDSGILLDTNSKTQHNLVSSLVTTSHYSHIFTPLTMLEVLQKDLFVERSGKIRDPTSGKIISLAQAFSSGIVDPLSIQIRHNESGKLISCESALKAGILDGDTGILITSDGNALTFREAVTSGLAVVALDFENINLIDAVQQGLYNPASGMILSSVCGKEVTLKEALVQGVVGTEFTRIIDPHSNTKLTIQEAADSGLIDLDSGTMEDPFTGKSLTIVEAFKNNLLVTYTTGPDNIETRIGDVHTVNKYYVYDTHQPAEMELYEAVHKGLVHPKTGTITHPHTGKQLTLIEAVNCNVISLYSTLEDPTTGQLATLQHLLESGKMSETCVQLFDISKKTSLTISESLKTIILPNISTATETSIGIQLKDVHIEEHERSKSNPCKNYNYPIDISPGEQIMRIVSPAPIEEQLFENDKIQDEACELKDGENIILCQGTSPINSPDILFYKPAIGIISSVPADEPLSPSDDIFNDFKPKKLEANGSEHLSQTLPFIHSINIPFDEPTSYTVNPAPVDENIFKLDGIEAKPNQLKYIQNILSCEGTSPIHLTDTFNNPTIDFVCSAPDGDQHCTRDQIVKEIEPEKIGDENISSIHSTGNILSDEPTNEVVSITKCSILEIIGSISLNSWFKNVFQMIPHSHCSHAKISQMMEYDVNYKEEKRHVKVIRLLLCPRPPV